MAIVPHLFRHPLPLFGMDVASTDLSPELRTLTCPLRISTRISNRHPIKKPSKWGVGAGKRLDKNKRMVLKFYLLELEQNPKVWRMSKKASGEDEL